MWEGMMSGLKKEGRAPSLLNFPTGKTAPKGFMGLRPLPGTPRDLLAGATNPTHCSESRGKWPSPQEAETEKAEPGRGLPQEH